MFCEIPEIKYLSVPNMAIHIMRRNDKKDRSTCNPFDDKEFGDLFENLYEPLCRFALKFVGQPDTAEDIVQEQFVYFWINQAKIKKLQSVRSYLFTAVKSRSISHLKMQYTRYTQSETFDTTYSTPISNIPDPERALENKELAYILECALESLPEKCRTIFTLKKFGELSNKEIADKLSISVKTVEAQMTIAFKKLTHYLSSRWPLLLLTAGLYTLLS